MSQERIDPVRLAAASLESADADPSPDLGIPPAASKVALTLRVRLEFGQFLGRGPGPAAVGARFLVHLYYIIDRPT
jgi:hypothetical protein